MHETQIPSNPIKFAIFARKHQFLSKNINFAYPSWNVRYRVVMRIYTGNTRKYQCSKQAADWIPSGCNQKLHDLDLGMLQTICCISYASILELTFYRVFGVKQNSVFLLNFEK